MKWIEWKDIRKTHYFWLFTLKSWKKLRHVIYFYFWKWNCRGTSFQKKKKEKKEKTVQKPHLAAVCPAATECYGKYKYHLVKYLRVGNQCAVLGWTETSVHQSLNTFCLLRLAKSSHLLLLISSFRVDFCQFNEEALLVGSLHQHTECWLLL